MSGLKNSTIDGHVRFSKAMQNFRNEITKQLNTSDALDSTAKSKEIQLLENVRRAAQGGYQASRLTNQIETFIASQESTARLLNSDQTGAREILTFCALDLALTTRQSSTSLLEVAMKYLKGSQKLNNTRHSDFFNDVYRLVRETKLTKTVPELLLDATLPLNLAEWKEKSKFWKQLSDKIAKFQETQFVLDAAVEKNDNGDCMLAGQKIFQEIVDMCAGDYNYLKKIMFHLTVLQSIVPNDERSAISTETALLSQTVDSYLGHQIFDLNVAPESLEHIANKLGVHLVHNVLVNCCPKLTFNDSLRTVKSDSWGSIILNKNSSSRNSESQDKNQDPNQCVVDILSELLQTIKRLYPDCPRVSSKDMVDLCKDNEILQILDKTCCFENLDLSELSVGDHTVAFFLNLWNLLFLHALLTVWVSDLPINSLRHFVSLSSINYLIGDLGRISLATLRSKLLGSMSWEPEYFFKTDDINEVAWQDLDLVHDPRVIFAMTNEFYESPAIRIYHPDTLNKDLNQALSDYLEIYCKKDSEYNEASREGKRLYKFPEIVERYEKFMEINVSNVDYSNMIINQSNQNTSLIQNYFSKSDKVMREYQPVTVSYEVVVHYDKLSPPKIESSMKRSTTSSYYNLMSWSSRSIKPTVLSYLEDHCWLLSYLVKKIHKDVSASISDSSCDNAQRTKCFENHTNASWVTTLANALFDCNPTLASIQENICLNDLWEYWERCIKDDRIANCLEVINALPPRLLYKYTEVQCLKDKLLYQLIHSMDSIDAKLIKQYIHQIKDVNVLAQTILFNMDKWPVHLCQDALHHVIDHRNKHKLPSHCRFRLNETLCRVTVFYKMLPFCKGKELDSQEATWHDVVYCTEKSDPGCIVHSLIEAERYELCLEWLEYQAFPVEMQPLVTQDLLIGLLKNDDNNFENARKLLSSLPVKQSLRICKASLKKLLSMRAMKFLSDWLLENCEEHHKNSNCRLRLGVEMLSQILSRDRPHYLYLIKEPLLLMEQLLMNCKFECLSKITDVIEKFRNAKRVDFPVDIFDRIVRFYAAKSLDFRVSTHRDGLDFKSKDSNAWTISIDNDSRSGEFIMPATVPTKEEWVSNMKVRKCMCCLVVTFSMFNRRHHCRRCGRVVCASCSQQRMQVQGYPKSVLVRVCDDCKHQTVLMQSQGSSSAASSVVLECWRLSKDDAHNRTVREEFSFEHAPNVSLCLAILSLHSDHKAYVSFLLDRCDEMKKLLQPGPGGRVNPEVDHGLLIKMIRSLLVAVKVKCVKLGLNAGLTHCDRFLSQVDLIATLVQSDCLALIPTDESLDDHAFRKLRDLLTEKEHWTLALDVSTKTGLDTQGVWAAWGKACLKAGYLDRARTKFSHCMEKVLNENLDDWVMLGYPDTEFSSRSSEESVEMQQSQRPFNDAKSYSPGRIKRHTLKNRPTKDPPLLVEILQILENQSQLSPDQPGSQPKSATAAHEILTTLNTLKAVSQGQCSFVHHYTSHNVYYEESLHYLLTYGSSSSILEFYVKHEQFEKCLGFVMENCLEPELFFNSLYLRCLNMGHTEKLLHAMRADDASLLTWKKYLCYTCHNLDKKGYLNTLYHLQLFMRDFIRAAMTCIRFYKNEARNYTDLCGNVHYLVDAQRHLESELSIDQLSIKKRRKSVGSAHGGLTMEMEPSEIDKHINTISRQLEIAKFLGNSEREGRSVAPYLKILYSMDQVDNTHSIELPTLFGNQHEKTRLAVLAILCGRDTEEGFGIAFRIVQDYNLKQHKVYSLAGHVLALEKKVSSIEQLIKCCRSSGAPDSLAVSDRVLTHCVKQLLSNQADSQSDCKDNVDSLIKLITDVELKISAYIESKQLKAAYLLAVKNQRAYDIRRILKEADRLGQNAIRTICTKWLKQNSL
ncbi:hypothetical protein TKK_0008627 [Trichogramma kaykai]